MHHSEDLDIKEESKVSKHLTSKSIYTDKIAKEILNSRSKVDKRLLNLHKISENSRSSKTDLINYLGVKANLSKRLSIGFIQPSPADLVKKDETSGNHVMI